jgi:hypothetical protein
VVVKNYLLFKFLVLFAVGLLQFLLFLVLIFFELLHLLSANVSFLVVKNALFGLTVIDKIVVLLHLI